MASPFGLPCRCTHAWESYSPPISKPRKVSFKELNMLKAQTLLKSVALHFLDSEGEKEDGSLKHDSFKANSSNLRAKVWKAHSLRLGSRPESVKYR